MAQPPEIVSKPGMPPTCLGWTVEVSKSSGNKYFFHIATKKASYDVPKELAAHGSTVVQLKQAKAAWDAARRKPKATAAQSATAGSMPPPQISKSAVPVTGVQIMQQERERAQTEQRTRQIMAREYEAALAPIMASVKEGKAGQGSTFSWESVNDIRTALHGAGGHLRFTWLSADGAPTAAPLARDAVATLRGRWELQQPPTDKHNARIFPSNSHMWRSPPCPPFVRYVLADVADDHGLSSIRVGEGDEQHVVVYQPSHPPPEELEKDEKEAEVAAATSAVHAENAARVSHIKANSVPKAALAAANSAMSATAVPVGGSKRGGGDVMEALRADKAKRARLLHSAATREALAARAKAAAAKKYEEEAAAAAKHDAE